jgi:hypothetical protein
VLHLLAPLLLLLQELLQWLLLDQHHHQLQRQLQPKTLSRYQEACWKKAY